MAEIYGCEVPDLPDDILATGVVIVARGISKEDWSHRVAFFRSDSVPVWEVPGLALRLYQEGVTETAELVDMNGDDPEEVTV